MAEALPSDDILSQFGLKEDTKLELKMMGFVKSPHKDTFMFHLTYITRFLVTVTPMTTIHQIKDLILERYKLLTYEQIDIDYFTTSLSDTLTLKDMMKMYPNFHHEKYLRFTVIFPGKMFSQVFESFKEMGMSEEKALAQAKSFMETVHKKESKFDYDKDASEEEIAKKKYAKLEYEIKEQDKLTDVMWTSLTFAMSGLQVKNDGPKGNPRRRNK